MQFEVSPEDLDRIIEALDSHVYWQLSDPYYRSDAEVLDPGSDDPEQRSEIEACWQIADKLNRART